MLRPTLIAQALQFQDATIVRVGGRRAFRLRGTPITPLSDFFWKVGGLIALGASDYVVTVDATSGILLAAEVYIDGRLARQEEITDVVIDASVNLDSFTPST